AGWTGWGTAGRAVDERERDDGLHVDDLATPDHLAGLAELERARLDVLVFVHVGLFVGLLQPRDTEEDHLFVAVARRRVEGGQTDDALRPQAHLLLALPAPAV